MKRTQIAEILLIVFGIFLVIDSFFLHLITFNYAAIGLAFLDPIISHAMIGFVFIFVGAIGLKKS